MAARLLRIKAQMLLPRGDGEEAWDDPRAELVRRLLEYQQMREVVDVLERARRGAPQPVRARLPAAGARAAARRRSRSRSASCSPPSTASCASRREPTMHDVIPRAIDVPGAITIIRALLALRARAQWTDLVHARRRAMAGPLDAARPARDGEARRAARRSSPDPLPTWRSRVTPLAKLLEAALFASARPIPTEELAALDPEASQGRARSRARRAARALRRRRPRRRARGDRRRLADPHARRVHRGDRARAARGASGAAARRRARDARAHRLSPADRPRRDRGDSRRRPSAACSSRCTSAG